MSDSEEEKKEQNFEKAINRLEEIVEKLEEGGLELDEALDKFSEGVELVKFCNERLNKAEEKIEMVLKEDDEFKDIIPFSEKEE